MTDCRFEFEGRISNGPPRPLISLRSSQKTKNVSKVGKKREKRGGALKCEIKPFSEITEGRVCITLPLRTVSEANSTEHWTKKHRRHKRQQLAISLALNPLKCQIKLPCHIKLTRFAPRKLDKHDNLPISMKYILDACCAIITGNFIAGRADDDDRISVSYDQETCSEYGVKVEFLF